ncbi:unnamed protein product [Rotaria sp. Silwood2]|nr:unnamed protein product [Rotaria sp. Silwood2]CAF2852414.1 unnamed protein product [Rotaria sp. Silwood2]CAF3004439.1 unnamed protein product [Rotaria sp. Silwood2]CAF4183114.1 unnamed protein product [Rotaria sp. Silwood2]CAF4188529.1 unnamed protein product [Rotaria sp. Silwood2]
MSNLESPTTEKLDEYLFEYFQLIFSILSLTHHDHHDIDDDDDQVNSSHKIIPTTHEPTASEDNKPDTQSSKASSTADINQSNISNIDVLSLIQNDLKKYVNTPIPKDYSDFVRCHVKRVKEGLTKGFETVFTLYFDGQNENNQTLLLSARKHITIGGHAEYFIGIDFENPSKNLNDGNSLATLKGINIMGSEYVLYDHQNSSTNEHNKHQSAAIIYAGETIIDEWRSGNSIDLIQMENKAPIYDEKSKTFSLKLHDSRIRLPSHKNFQLIASNDNHDGNAVMQFGRIDDNNFALDYRHPLTAIQAFAIALSSFHNRFHS